MLGLLAALAGDRAARALVLVLALSLGLEWSGTAYYPLVWAQLDVLAALLIVRPGMPRRDVAIVLLIAPAWAAYLLPDPWRHWTSTSVVVCQFALTALAPCLRERLRTGRLPPMRNPFDFRMRASV